MAYLRGGLLSRKLRVAMRPWGIIIPALLALAYGRHLLVKVARNPGNALF